MAAFIPFLHLRPGRSVWLRAAVFLLAMLFTGIPASSITIAHAAGGKANFSLQPTTYDPNNPVTQSYFVLNMKQGSTTTLGVRVTNIGTAAGSVNLYPEDATTGQTSGIVYHSLGAPLKDVGAWINLEIAQLTLAPGKSQVVQFKLSVPNGVRAGQHVGGIVAGQTKIQTTATKKQQFHLSVNYLAIMAVQVNLSGSAIEQLTATGIQAAGANNKQTLQIHLNNTGTMMVHGSGSLQIMDTHDDLLQNIPITLDTFLPATSIDYPVTVQKKALPTGTYQAKLMLAYGQNEVLNYTTNFIITQQQVTQAFQPIGTPLQGPGAGSNILSSIPLWLLALIGLMLLSGVFFWSQKLYVITVASRRKSKRGRQGRLAEKEETIVRS